MIGTTLWSGLRIAFALCLYLFGGAGGAGAQSGAGAAQTSGRIVWIEPKAPKGMLKVLRAKGLAPVSAAEGMLVRRGYVLVLDARARAAVVCGDGKRRELAPGPQGCPCTQPCTPEICGIRYDGSTVAPTWGPDTGGKALPVAASPRAMRLENRRPALRWALISGATKKPAYTVTLYGNGLKADWAREGVAAARRGAPDNAQSRGASGTGRHLQALSASVRRGGVRVHGRPRPPGRRLAHAPGHGVGRSR